MTRTTAITVFMAAGGYVAAFSLSVVAQSSPMLRGMDSLDLLTRVLVPLSGGMKNLAAITSGGMTSRFSASNAAIYAVIGLMIGIVLQILRPTIERPLD